MALGLPAASPCCVRLHQRCYGIVCFGVLAWLVLADGRFATHKLEPISISRPSWLSAMALSTEKNSIVATSQPGRAITCDHRARLGFRLCHRSAVHRLLFTDYRLPITNYRLPITGYQLPTTDYRLPITNYRLLPFPITVVPIFHFSLTRFCGSLSVTRKHLYRGPP